MKRFIRSKFFLSLAAIVMIASAVAIPLTGSIIRSHAAGTDIERHTPIKGAVHIVKFASGGFSFSKQTDVPCVPGPADSITPPLTIGDHVVGNIGFTTPDPTEEAPEGETLLVSDTANSFSVVIGFLSGTAPFDFVAPSTGDVLTACVQGGSGGDETGTVSGTVTPAKSITSLKLNLRDPHESPSAELKEEGQLNPLVFRLVNVAACLAEFLPYAGVVFHAGTHTLKILKIIQFRVGVTTTAIAIFQDFQTGNVIVRVVSVVADVVKFFIKFDSCAELLGSYFFSTPPTSRITPPITPVPVPTPPPPPSINTR